MATQRKAPLKRPVDVDKGGMETEPSQPLKRAPLREPYAARSGEPPEKAGTPETVKRGRSKSKARGKG